MSVPRSRVLDLMKVRCKLFSSTFNPEGIRTGNKILRQRLIGPSVAAYYPKRTINFRDLKEMFPYLETWDDKEEHRKEHVQVAKARGKGAPKKKRTPPSADTKGKRGKR